MKPAEQAQRFDRAMQHANKALSCLVQLPSKANELEIILQASLWMQEAMRELGTDLIQESLKNMKDPSANGPVIRRRGNIVEVDFNITRSL